MHLCPDELAALGLLGSIGVVCRYCWHRLTGWCRRGGGE